MAVKKKRKTNSGGSVDAAPIIPASSASSSSSGLSYTYDSPSGRSSSSSTASAYVVQGETSAAASSADASGEPSEILRRHSRSSSGVSHTASTSELDLDVDEGDAEEGERQDVMGTPAALAPSTIANLGGLRLAFTPSVVSSSTSALCPSTPSGSGEDSTFRRLNFTTKECATPGRYDARHKLGQPLAVYCRVKPVGSGEEQGMATVTNEQGQVTSVPIMQVESDTSLLCTAPPDSASVRHGENVSRFTFTRMFGPEATQEEVYMHSTKPLVDAFYGGQNGLIFAYGITASGKTYTMQGTSQQPGLIPRIVLDLFQKVMSGGVVTPPDAADASAADASSSAAAAATAVPAGPPPSLLPPGQRFTVKASYLEVYNESINDLLVEPVKPGAAPNGGKSNAKTRAAKATASAAAAPVCRLQQSSNASDEMSVVGLREVEIRTHREALALLEQGQANRSMTETALNADSSRSHSVFTLKLVLPSGQVWARLSVVDLAGSERSTRVQHAQAGKEGRMRETVNINQSLLVLGRCLEALRYNQQAPRKPRVVPFRESAITRLFKDSLSGWGRTVMLTAASQRAADYDETLHALKYAAVAKEVRVAVHKVDHVRRAAAAEKAAERIAEKAAEKAAAAAAAAAARNKRVSVALSAACSSGAPSGASSRRPSAAQKRPASQSLADLDELEHVATTASSSWDADDFAPSGHGSAPSYDSLLHECFLLRQRVVSLELAAVATEEQVRAELTQAHEEALLDMEEACQARVDEAYVRAEEKARKMMEIWKKEMVAQQAAQQQQAAGKENGRSANVPVLGAKALRSLTVPAY